MIGINWSSYLNRFGVLMVSHKWEYLKRERQAPNLLNKSHQGCYTFSHSVFMKTKKVVEVESQQFVSFTTHSSCIIALFAVAPIWCVFWFACYAAIGDKLHGYLRCGGDAFGALISRLLHELVCTGVIFHFPTSLLHRNGRFIGHTQRRAGPWDNQRTVH